MADANLNQLWARALVEELARGGVERAVVCPGSRNTPLALACAEQLVCHSVIDERSAAFFALGMAKVTGAPVVVVATSGTAGANFYPAVIEASHAQVPLIVLTADRPLELQGWGAPQTMDQQRLYGGFARWFADLGIPEAATAPLLHLRATAARAVATSLRVPRGPVQLNVPLREPLAPVLDPALAALMDGDAAQAGGVIAAAVQVRASDAAAAMTYGARSATTTGASAAATGGVLAAAVQAQSSDAAAAMAAGARSATTGASAVAIATAASDAATGGAIAAAVQARPSEAAAAMAAGARSGVVANAPAAPRISALARDGRPGSPITSLVAPSRAPDAAALDQLRARMASTERGVILCGPRDAADGLQDAAIALGRAYGYPVLAEATSNLRFGRTDEICALYDAVLRVESFASQHRPQLVLRLGGGLTPKGPQAWLDASGAYIAQLSDGGALQDPQHTGAVVIEGDPVLACRQLAAGRNPVTTPWTRAFATAEQRARTALDAAFATTDTLTEPRVAAELAAALPAGAQLFVSSSMPIRDLDAFAARGQAIRVLANRGVNGIDGVTSTALGVAAASDAPTVLLTGDLAFFHDLGGLLTAHRSRLSLTVVVVNNDGGGIFSFLPIARFTDRFEALFGTPHGLDLAPAAQLFHARHATPRTATELRAQLKTGLTEGGLHVLEVRVDRAANVRDHQALFAAMAQAVGEGPWH